MSERRKHNKVSNLPPEIIAAINDAIVNKRKTYREIERWLRDDGYDVSRSGLQRYGETFLTKLERISLAKEQAKSIIETSSGLKTEMSEATSTVAFQLLMDMLINTDTKDVNKATMEAIRTLATLERSTVSREKLKLEYDKGINAAAEKITQNIRDELENNPEAYEHMRKLIEKSASDLKGS